MKKRFKISGVLIGGVLFGMVGIPIFIYYLTQITNTPLPLIFR